ncbi:hypothetical protein ACFZCL_17545 [Streptomyces sp. NPDC008159]|uniref:hypothetical protein n=1 Tax=Streptomyces sp. NPDC008159 TaxID=3364817 RepID=UPI0036EC8369
MSYVVRGQVENGYPALVVLLGHETTVTVFPPVSRAHGHRQERPAVTGSPRDGVRVKSFRGDRAVPLLPQPTAHRRRFDPRPASRR